MAEEVIEGVNPTRMELLAIRKRKKLAMKGHKLLSEKRDALVVQFFEIIKDRNALRNKVNRELRTSYSVLVQAQEHERKNRDAPDPKAGTSAPAVLGSHHPALPRHVSTGRGELFRLCRTPVGER